MAVNQRGVLQQGIAGAGFEPDLRPRFGLGPHQSLETRIRNDVGDSQRASLWL
jgi:hypothetical protein